MDAEPAWIELMFKRHNRHHCFATPYIMRMNVERVEETVSQIPGGRVQLRTIALQRLRSEDLDWVVIALLALFVVGESVDVAAVEPLTKHPVECVKNAAKTCLFELRKAR